MAASNSQTDRLSLVRRLLQETEGSYIPSPPNQERGNVIHNVGEILSRGLTAQQSAEYITAIFISCVSNKPGVLSAASEGYEYNELVTVVENLKTSIRASLI